MNSSIKNPKILLLKCSIEYLYREETKFTCIDPIVLQVRTPYWNCDLEECLYTKILANSYTFFQLI